MLPEFHRGLADTGFVEGRMSRLNIKSLKGNLSECRTSLPIW